jgi:hypothetical protein
MPKTSRGFALVFGVFRAIVVVGVVGLCVSVTLERDRLIVYNDCMEDVEAVLVDWSVPAIPPVLVVPRSEVFPGFARFSTSSAIAPGASLELSYCRGELQVTHVLAVTRGGAIFSSVATRETHIDCSSPAGHDFASLLAQRHAIRAHHVFASLFVLAIMTLVIRMAFTWLRRSAELPTSA